MTINIADNSPRISYSVAEGVTQTSFAVPFEFFNDSDLNVYLDGTLQTITTNYTVAGGDGSTGTITMSVTGASGGSTVVITRDIELERTTDFPVSGAFNIVALNTELDRLVAIAADLEDRAARAIQAQDFDSTVSYTLPLVDDRKGKVLGFNATTGAVEAGPEIADTQSLANVSADIALLADIEDGTLDTNAITNVNGIRTDVTTVSGISANVTTVANNDANVTTVATNDADITTVATNIASVNTVATNIADVITVANDLNEAISEVETVANDLNEAVSEIDTVASSITNVDLVGNSVTNVNTVAGSISNVNTVAGDISNVNAVATNQTNIDAVAGNATNINAVAADATDIGVVSTNIANVNTVAGISANVTTVATIQADVTTVAADQTDIGTVSTNIANVNTVAGVSGNVTTVAGISSNVTTVASISGNVTTVAGDTTNIGTIATNLTGTNTIGTVATNINNVNNVGNNISNVNSVATNNTNINTVATDLTGSNNIGTVAGAISNVNAVGGDIANVNTVASNLASVNAFGEQYRIGSTDPTTSLDTGDLFYNTTSGTLKVYTGSAWEQGVTAGSGFLPLSGGALTGDLSGTNITVSGYVRGPSSFTIDPAAHGDNTGTVIIAGNLQVDGSTTTINSTTLTVDDLNMTLASGAASAAAANGAGITVDGASASITYNASGDTWDFNKGLSVPSMTTTGNVNFGDGDKALFGASSDLQIYHDGSNSTIADFGTGVFNITSDGPAIQLSTNTGELLAYFAKDGSSQLYYDNNKRIETTSDGATTSGNHTISDGGQYKFGTGGTRIAGSTTNNYITFHTNGGAEKFRVKSTGADVTGRLDANDVHVYKSSGNAQIGVQADSGIGSMEVGGSSGAFIDVKIPYSTDFQTRYGNNYLNCTGNYVLQHNGATKLTTTSSGVNITGTLNATTFTGDGSGLTGIGFTTNVVTSNTTASKNNHYYLNAASVTLTLPASPSVGDEVRISEVAGNTDCVIGRNGSNIMGDASDLTIDTAYLVLSLRYVDATIGWAFS